MLLMPATTLLVKNMVCDRCVIVMKDILQNESICFQRVIFGEIHLFNELSQEQKERLLKAFGRVGFELIGTQSKALIENIKQLVIKRARNEADENQKRAKLSHYLSREVNYEYTYLSSLFSSVEGKTIEKYFIEQRVEKAKELLMYGQLTLSQIAFDLEYSSVAHLSTQFKKVTGSTPTDYKETGAVKRHSLDGI